ncbi:MAG: alpha/beta hydrolase [Planctomycetota bacterium]|nr:alpha/beta hydrolase [Planctomycetota bacterium]
MVFFIDSLARRLIYHPEPPDSSLDRPPSTMHGDPVQELWIENSSPNPIHAWFYPHTTAKFGLLFCHGNAGHLAHRHPTAELLRAELNCHVLLFDYRGYGRSRGVPDEAGVCLDTELAFKKLCELTQLGADKQMIFGRSLGAAIAIETATRVSTIKGLILASPFTCIADMCGEMLGSNFPARYLSERFDSIGKIPQISAPSFIFHGERDSLIPIAQGRRLFDASQSRQKEWLAIENADHNDLITIGGTLLLDRLKGFALSRS